MQTPSEKDIETMVEKKTVYRDSKDGQFIAKKEADRRPATTEKERVRVSPPKAKGK